MAEYQTTTVCPRCHLRSFEYAFHSPTANQWGECRSCAFAFVSTRKWKCIDCGRSHEDVDIPFRRGFDPCTLREGLGPVCPDCNGSKLEAYTEGPDIVLPELDTATCHRMALRGEYAVAMVYKAAWVPVPPRQPFRGWDMTLPDARTCQVVLQAQPKGVFGMRAIQFKADIGVLVMGTPGRDDSVTIASWISREKFMKEAHSYDPGIIGDKA